MKRRFIFNFAVFAVIAVCCLLVYGNTMNSPFLFDGVDFIRDNSEIKDLGRALHFFRTPNRSITNFSYALNYRYSALDTTGYHIVNLGIHILCSFFVFLFVRYTVLRVDGDDIVASSSAVIASLIFAVHPIQTESVTYIYQRSTCLAAMFYMASVVAYIKFRIAENRGSKFVFLGIAVFAAVCAFLSKGNSYLLLLIIPLYELYFFRKFSRKSVLISLMSIIPAGAVMFLYIFSVKGTKIFEILTLRFTERNFTAWERLLTESRVLVFYLSQLIYPHPSRLSLAHDVELSKGLFSPVTTVFSVISILLIISAAVIYAPKFRIFSFGIMWFFVNHLLESTVLPLELVFEHRNYLPSAGIFMLVSYGFTKAAGALKGGLKRTGFLYAVPVAVIAVFAVWTFQRNAVWADQVSIWKDAADKASGNSRAFNGLGDAYLNEGNIDEAVIALEKSVALDSLNFRAHNNLGTIYGRRGDYRNAIRHFEKAVSIKPNHSPPFTNIGNCYYLLKDYQTAINFYREALERDGNNQEAVYNLINTLLLTGGLEEARKLSDSLVRGHPENKDYREQAETVAERMRGAN